MFRKLIGAACMMAAAFAVLAVNVAQAQALEKKKITIAVGGKGRRVPAGTDKPLPVYLPA